MSTEMQTEQTIENQPGQEQGGAPEQTQTQAPELVNVNNMTSEDFRQLIEKNEILRKVVDSEKDSHFSKSLKTWKENNLSKEVEKEIAKRYPAETEADKKMRELEQKLIRMENEKIQEQLKNDAIKTLTEKNIPIDFVELVIADSQDATNKRIDLISSQLESIVNARVEAKFKENGRQLQQSTIAQTSYETAKQTGDVKNMIKNKLNI